MLIDTRTLSAGQKVETDICIIGAGPAGITFAHDLIESGHRVHVLESGGEKYDGAVQNLSQGEISGDLHEALESTHRRQVGGTANHLILKMADKQYGYRFTPLDAIDFEQREAVPHSGWPIKKTDLDPYYAKIQQVCGVGYYDYSAEYWQRNDQFLLPFDQRKATNGVFMFGPTGKFSKDFPAEIEASDNVTLYTYATVVELLCDEGGSRVQSALVRMFDGKEVTFQAKHFIIASNALETPRLLLNSRRQHPNGIGNHHDNVGRYYMDHNLVASGYFYPNDPKLINQMGFYDMQKIDSASVLGRVDLSESAMRGKGLRNFSAAMFPMPWDERDLLTMTSLEAIKTYVRWHWRKSPKGLGQHIKNIFHGRKRLYHALYDRVRYGVPFFVGLAQGGWSKATHTEKKYNNLELLAIVEQSPNPQNRITLIDEKDALGCNKIKLHYQCAQADIESVKQAQKVIGEALEATGLGRYEPPKFNPEDIKNLPGIHHMMGTTRMSKNPKHGVVDQHCCVHGMTNLFIAGSAVFTTGGFANPTLTNLAISLRVADRVRTLLDATDIDVGCLK